MSPGTAEKRLDGKVALVTGGGARGALIGTGQATAILYARHGARVLLADVDLDRARATGNANRRRGR